MKTLTAKKKGQLVRRHARIRSTISGTAERPRLAVFRSNKNIYAQLIDDVAQVTLAAASDIKATKGTKTERATAVGTELAQRAIAKNITTVVFDRGGFAYTGRVQALADAARAGGLKF